MLRLKKCKRLISILLATIMLLGIFTTTPLTASAESITYYYDNHKVVYTIVNSWGDSQIVDVTITNTGTETIENWILTYDDNCGTIVNIWNAKLSQTDSGVKYMRNIGHNANILPGQSVSFGYQLDNVTGEHPSSFVMIQKRVEKTDGFTADLLVEHDWGAGFIGKIVLTNTTDKPIEWWELTFDTNFTITEITNSWAATLTENGDCNYTFKGTFTGIIAPNSSVDLGFQAIKNGTPMISDVSLTEIVAFAVTDDITGDTTTFEYDDYTIEYIVTGNSGNTQEIVVKITNTGTEVIENWMLAYNDFNGNIQNIWGAVIERFDFELNELLLGYEAYLGELPSELEYIRNTGENASIAPNESVIFGYTLSDVVDVPYAIVMCQKRVIRDYGYDVYVEFDEENEEDEEFFSGSIILENESDQPLEFWELDIEANFTIDEIEGDYDVPAVTFVNGAYKIKGTDSTNTHIIGANSSISIGFSGSKTNTPEIIYSELTEVVVDKDVVLDTYWVSSAQGDFEYRCGVIVGRDNRTIQGMSLVLEMLKYLARVPDHAIDTPEAYRAARVTSDTGSLELNDVLEILKKLRGVPGAIPNCKCATNDCPNFSDDYVVVFFEPQSGRGIHGRIVEKNTPVGRLPTPTRDTTLTFRIHDSNNTTITVNVPWTFNRWWLYEFGGEEFEATTVIDKDMTVYGRWGRAPTMGNNFPPTPTRTDFTFNGWFTQRTDGTQIIATRRVSENATFHAQWTRIEHTIRFNTNGGGSNPSRIRGVGQGLRIGSANFPPPPHRAGYIFDDWWTTESGAGTRVTATTPITHTIINELDSTNTLQARWRWTGDFNLVFLLDRTFRDDTTSNPNQAFVNNIQRPFNSQWGVRFNWDTANPSSTWSILRNKDCSGIETLCTSAICGNDFTNRNCRDSTGIIHHTSARNNMEYYEKNRNGETVYPGFDLYAVLVASPLCGRRRDPNNSNNYIHGNIWGVGRYKGKWTYNNNSSAFFATGLSDNNLSRTRLLQHELSHNLGVEDNCKNDRCIMNDSQWGRLPALTSTASIWCDSCTREIRTHLGR